MTRRVEMTPGLLARLRGRQLGDFGAPRGSVQSKLDSMSQAGVAASSAGIVVLRRTFTYQSYFDSTLRERAILAQPVSEPIIPSTKQEENTSGYGIGLHSASESPVAVQLLLGGGKSGGPTKILRPGESFQLTSRFDGIRYGLPFGWLGGGTVQLHIMQGKNDRAFFVGAGGETLIHRIRLPIFATTDNPAASGRGTSPNWPVSFPWANAFDLNGNPQKGQPLLVADPTKVILRLRKAIAAPAVSARVRMVLLQTDDLDLGSNGTTYDALNVSGTWYDIVFSTSAASGFQIGGVASAEFPYATLDDKVTRFGGPSTIAAFIDMDNTVGSSAAAPVYLDIERFGII